MLRDCFIRNTPAQYVLVERLVTKQLVVVYPDYVAPTGRSMQQLLSHRMVVHRDIRARVEWAPAGNYSIAYKEKLPTTRSG